jgi:hypothetical protein
VLKRKLKIFKLKNRCYTRQFNFKEENKDLIKILKKNKNVAFFEHLEKKTRLKGLLRFYDTPYKKKNIAKKKNFYKYNFIKYNQGLIIKKKNLNFFFYRSLKLLTLKKKKVMKKKKSLNDKYQYVLLRRKMRKLYFSKKKKNFNFLFNNMSIHDYIMFFFNEYKKSIFFKKSKNTINKYSKKKIKSISDFVCSKLYKNKFMGGEKFSLKNCMAQVKKKKYSFNLKNLTGFLRSTKIESNLTQFIKNYFFFKYICIINSKPLVQSIIFLEKESMFFFKFFPENIVLHRDQMFPYHPQRLDRFTSQFILYRFKEPLGQRKHNLLSKIKSDIVNIIDIYYL